MSVLLICAWFIRDWVYDLIAKYRYRLFGAGRVRWAGRRAEKRFLGLIQKRMARLRVLGLGYVGLPYGEPAAKAGFQVRGGHRRGHHRAA
jgi:hypothetical protein